MVRTVIFCFVTALIGKAIRDHVTNNKGWRNLQEEGVDSGPVGSHSNRKLDGKVAAALCMGGPTKYVYREGSGLTDAFLSDKVCPHIRAKFGGRVAVVLGKSLLWVCKEPLMIPQVPACLRQ